MPRFIQEVIVPEGWTFANAVKAMLVSDEIDANGITTAGYGQDRPLASNDSEEGRAKNRRTELTVTSK